MARLRRSFTTDFKREAANLVLKDGYSVAEASRSLDNEETALRRWIDQLGVTPKAIAFADFRGEYNWKGKLLGQFPDGARVSKLED